MLLKKVAKKVLLGTCLLGLTFSFAEDNKYKIDYEKGYVKAYGGACSKTGVPRLLAKMQAKAAARAVALRNLAEAISNVNVIGYTKVKDEQFQTSEVLTAVNTLIRGAVRCPDEQYVFDYDPTERMGCVDNYCVMVKLLYGPNGARLLTPIVKKLKQEGYPTKPPKTQEIAQNPQEVSKVEQTDLKEVDGVIIDVRDFPDFTPSAAPIIVTKTMGGQYKPVFAATMVDESAIRRKGAVVGIVATRGQLNNILQSWNIKHPLYIKAVGITSDGAIVISNQDAIKLITADQKNNFISKGNVIIWMSPATAQNY